MVAGRQAGRPESSVSKNFLLFVRFTNLCLSADLFCSIYADLGQRLCSRTDPCCIPWITPAGLAALSLLPSRGTICLPG